PMTFGRTRSGPGPVSKVLVKSTFGLPTVSRTPETVIVCVADGVSALWGTMVTVWLLFETLIEHGGTSPPAGDSLMVVPFTVSELIGFEKVTRKNAFTPTLVVPSAGDTTVTVGLTVSVVVPVTTVKPRGLKSGFPCRSFTWLVNVI